jgi:hypothetical protein
MRVVEAIDAFLDWCGVNEGRRTYEHYGENLQRFATRIPPALAVAELKPFHVTRAPAEFPDRGVAPARLAERGRSTRPRSGRRRWRTRGSPASTARSAWHANAH